jgi:hypothetical protein
VSPSKKHISADDLAKQGAKKRKLSARLEQEKKEQTSKSNLTYRRRLDQKRIYLHITRWTDFKSLCVIFTFLSVSSFLPFFIMWAMMPTPTSFKPSNFALFMAFWSVFWIVGIFVARSRIKAKVLEEKKWIENLPFELIAYPDVLVYRSYPSIYFTIKFKRKKPELSYLLDVLSTTSYKVASKVEYEKVESYDDLVPPPVERLEDWFEEEDEVTEIPENVKNVIFKFEMRNDKASKFNRHRRWARKWILKICEVQLQAIHDKYPIESVTLNEGTIELDFDWTVSKRKWWQVF